MSFLFKKKGKKGAKLTSRKHKSIKWRVYKVNDEFLVGKKHSSKPNRRVIVLNADKNKIHLARVKSIKSKKDRQNLIPIEKYPDIRRESGVEKKKYKTNYFKKPIKESDLEKTNTRINKFDRKKIRKGLFKK